MATPKVTEITAVMAVYNSWMTMGRVLRALARAAQSVPLQLLLCENEGTDPSVDICQSERLGPTLIELGIPDHRVLPQMPQARSLLPEHRKMANMCLMWALFLIEVKTPYMLWLDLDVLIPSRGLHQMLQGMLSNPRLGAYGIDYPVEAGSQKMHDHLPQGCTLYRVEAMQEAAPIRSRGCPCQWIDTKLIELGWEVRKVPMVTAEHIE